MSRDKHLNRTQEVIGSIPFSSTISFRATGAHLLRCRSSHPLDVAPLRLAAPPPSASHLHLRAAKARM
jgi:hypothetical protein